MLKCASTYYEYMFRLNGWDQIDFKDIDWDHDVVFGFIMDPFVRHIKGLVEDLMFLEEKYQYDIDLFPETFSELAPVLGVHGLGFHQIYDNYCEKIFWIPLDHTISTEQLVEEFFEKYNINWEWNYRVIAHESNNRKKYLFQKIFQKSNGPGKDWFNITNQNDVLLYQTALAKF
jgi:hypothetical protein